MRRDCVHKSFEKVRNVQELWEQYFVSCNTIRFWFHHDSCSHVLGNRKSSRVSCSIAEETRETYERLSQRPQTLKNALNFLVELKPLFHESFQGSQKQFQSKTLVMLRTDVYVTADLYQAKRQDKPRIVWRYIISMLLLVPGERRELPYERGGMLIVSLRGVNSDFGRT